MGSRNLDKEMLKSLRNFTTTIKLCKDAHTGNKIARFTGLLNSLQTTFTKFDEDFALYKDDIIKKVSRTESAFNEVISEDGVDVPAFEYNDLWAEEQFSKYVEARDLLETVLDADTQPASKEVKGMDTELAVDSLRAEFQSIETSVTKLTTEIEGCQDGQMSSCSVIGYKEIVSKLVSRIDVNLLDKVQNKLAIATESLAPDFSNTKIRIKYRTFVQDQKEKLDYCSMMLVKKSEAKVVEEKPELQGYQSGSPRVTDRPKEQVFLEKTKPPKFDGDEVP